MNNTITATLTDDEVFELVRAELDKARARYPEWPYDMVYAAAIASEESGEVVKSVNNLTWGHGDDSLEDIRGEAIQAIAMWTRFLTETAAMNIELWKNNREVQAVLRRIKEIAP